jgi:hypothetical protein
MVWVATRQSDVKAEQTLFFSRNRSLCFDFEIIIDDTLGAQQTPVQRDDGATNFFPRAARRPTNDRRGFAARGLQTPQT